jgi:CheY-like chemotaxis protein
VSLLTSTLLPRPAAQSFGTTDDSLLGRRVLIVEDDAIISMLLEDMLADFGCEVVGTARRVEEALGVIGATTAIDAAVLDVNLHGTRSDLVADALAACGIPFVFLTGYGGNGIIDAHRDRPVLQKPFTQQDLVAALARLLANHSQAKT